MQNLFYNISQVLGITIIHSLWQGLLIYMALRLLMAVAPNISSVNKYKASFGVLSLMLGWFAYTLYTEVNNYTWVAAATQPYPLTVMLPNVAKLWTAPTDRYSVAIAAYLPYVTVVYICGLLFNTLKMAMAWNNIYRIRLNSSASGFQELVNKLAAGSGIKQKVQVAFSEYIDVPCITGYLKPMILLPFSISSYLSAEEIKVILLHELAHIKRNDYLLNLVQQAVGILLFFNPFSLLINRIINRERENCCDDVVISTTRSPLIYAQALLKLEQNKQTEWQLTLAATGKKYHLLNRIERIMKTKTNTVNIRPALLVLILLTFSLGSMAWFNPKIKDGKLSVKAISNPLTLRLNDTTKKKATKDASTAKKTPAKGTLKKRTGVEVAIDDAKMQRLEAEIEQHAAAIEKYYDSPEFKKLQDDMEKIGSEVEKYYNDPKLKELEQQMEKKSAEFEKMNDSPEMKKMQAEMEATGKKMEEYYNNPKYNKLQKDYEKAAELYGKAKYGSPEYKKYQQQYKKMADEFKSYNSNPGYKQQMEQTRAMGAKVREYYSSPEYTKQRDEIRAYSDSMRKAYQNPALKEQQAAIRELSQKVREYQRNPAIASEKEELRKLETEVHEYQRSPAFRKRTIAEIEATRDVKEAIRKEIAEVQTQAARATKRTAGAQVAGDVREVASREVAEVRTQAARATNRTAGVQLAEKDVREAIRKEVAEASEQAVAEQAQKAGKPSKASKSAYPVKAGNAVPAARPTKAAKPVVIETPVKPDTTTKPEMAAILNSKKLKLNEMMEFHFVASLLKDSPMAKIDAIINPQFSIMPNMLINPIPVTK